MPNPRLDKEFMGPLWFLGPDEYHVEADAEMSVQQFEWRWDFQRIRSPHILRCSPEEAQFKDGDTNYRLKRDLYLDGIAIIAPHVLTSYKQLPYRLSMFDMVYTAVNGILANHLMWTFAVYGEAGVHYTEVNFIKDAIENVRCQHVANMKTTAENISIKGKDNQPLNPEVTVASFVIIP